jgi:hypothetical protein
LQREHQKDAEKRLDARIAKTQGAGVLAFDLGRLLHLLKHFRPHRAVVTHFLHLQHPAIGPKPNLAQAGQVLQNKRPTAKS